MATRSFCLTMSMCSFQQRSSLIIKPRNLFVYTFMTGLPRISKRKNCSFALFNSLTRIWLEKHMYSFVDVYGWFVCHHTGINVFKFLIGLCVNWVISSYKNIGVISKWNRCTIIETLYSIEGFKKIQKMTNTGSFSSNATVILLMGRVACWMLSFFSIQIDLEWEYFSNSERRII